jgi:hypothetical protein
MWNQFSHRGTNFCRRSVGWGSCWVSKGHPSSSVWMGIRVERLVEIWFPDPISGPLVGCRSAIKRVAIFLVTKEGQSGHPLLREWKANAKGWCQILEASPCREARAVMLRAPSSLRVCVHDRSVDPLKSSQTNGMLRPISSTGECSPALGNEEGRP